MSIRSLVVCLGTIVAWAGIAGAQSPTALSLKPGDLWVMSGDSITAQRLHSNYIEAFYRTRYPELKLQFRNSGIGGNRTNHILDRFDYDLAAFKPTVISIELGMNDVGQGDDPSVYIAGMKKLIDRVRAASATPVLISSSPVNDGSKLDDWKGDRCRRIHPYTEALVKLAAEQKVLVVDQYHPLLGLWHGNKDAENKDKIALGGDPVHPGPTGQLTMAAVILENLGVDREVSAATLKADGTVVEARRCKLSNVEASSGGLSFTRLDERSPWPVPANARDALTLLPKIADLSRYELKVVDLPAGEYAVSFDGVEVGRVSNEELSKGWNMGTLATGPVAERGKKVLELVTRLQSTQNTAFRAASKANDTAKLAEAQAAIEATESELAVACQPVAIKVEVRRATK